MYGDADVQEWLPAPIPRAAGGSQVRGLRWGATSMREGAGLAALLESDFVARVTGGGTGATCQAAHPQKSVPKHVCMHVCMYTHILMGIDMVGGWGIVKVSRPHGRGRHNTRNPYH